MPQNWSEDKLIRKPDALGVELDPLTLDLDDDQLVKVIDARLEDAKKFYNSPDIDLKERRAKNKAYLLGKQLNFSQIKKYQLPYIDNLVFEAENTIKPIALSRLPDLLVKPAKDMQSSKDLAEDLTKLVNSDIRKRENRKVLGVAWKHLPVYFLGVIKAYWDPYEGKNGDYRFKVVHPEKIVLDPYSMFSDPEQMEWVAESVELSIKEAIMRWPNKEEEIRQVEGVTPGNEEEKMASRIEIWEVWFKWWDKAKKKEEEEENTQDNIDSEAPGIKNADKWEEIEAVCWKYKDIILGRMKNPYWDWSGEARLTDAKGDQLQPSELQGALNGAIDATVGKVYYNYFNRPQKPYIFLNYEVWGEYPLDSTSRVEQSLSLQDNINKRGMQISAMNDSARGKHVFSTKSGLNKRDIEKLDMDNPKQDLVVNGPLGETHQYIQGTPAPADLYQELNLDIQRFFTKMGTNSTTRGERGGDETATGRQILRESDFGRIDDMVEDTINPAAEKMSMWALQFIKLFYKKEHMIKFLGPEGDVAFTAITRDSVEDGVEVIVTASGVDKMMAKREAYERARMQLTDPLTFFTDVGASDPKGRTEKLLMFSSAPELYLKQYVQGQTIQDMTTQLNQPPVDGGNGSPTPPVTPAMTPAPDPNANMGQPVSNAGPMPQVVTASGGTQPV